MTQQKYVIAKRSQTNKINNWFEHCKKEQIPYITIICRTKYASVDFDFTNLTIANEKLLYDNGEHINKTVTSLYNRYSRKKNVSYLGGLPLCINDVLIKDSYTVARTLYDTIYHLLYP